MPILLQIIHLHESHTSGVAHNAYYCSVIVRLQRCDDRRLAWLSGSMPAVSDRVHLVVGDNSADDCSLPVIIRGNQSACAVMQVQCRISQYIGDPKVCELGTNGAHNHRLWSAPLNNESTDHHVIACLHKAPRTDVV